MQRSAEITGHRWACWSPRQVFFLFNSVLTFFWISRFEASSENSEDLVTPGPHSHLEPAGWLCRTPPLIHQGLARLPHRFLSPPHSPSPVPDGVGARTFCHSQGSENMLQILPSGAKSTQWVFPAEALQWEWGCSLHLLDSRLSWGRESTRCP